MKPQPEHKGAKIHEKIFVTVHNESFLSADERRLTQIIILKPIEK
jgi:hypothetical protein